MWWWQCPFNSSIQNNTSMYITYFIVHPRKTLTKTCLSFITIPYLEKCNLLCQTKVLNEERFFNLWFRDYFWYHDYCLDVHPLNSPVVVLRCLDTILFFSYQCSSHPILLLNVSLCIQFEHVYHLSPCCIVFIFYLLPSFLIKFSRDMYLGSLFIHN